MYRVFLITIALFSSVNSYYTSDYEENSPPRQFIEKLNDREGNEDEFEPLNPYTTVTPATAETKNTPNDEFEPLNPYTTVTPAAAETKNTTHTFTTHSLMSLDSKNLMCEDFEEYASNCTNQAKRIYNSSITLPLPHELKNWCKALKHLATCEYDWNTDCKDVTEKNFNELTIQGQLHVLDKVCHDDLFPVRYDKLLYTCIGEISKDWTACFLGFKFHADNHKKSTNNWMHYETHFFLCCARTQFRRCTLEVLLNSTDNCTTEQGIMLQKFSSIISEGEVFQDCNFNMVYSSCPGGDPRPPTAMVFKLMGNEPRSLQNRCSPLQTIKVEFLFLIIINFITC